MRRSLSSAARWRCLRTKQRLHPGRRRPAPSDVETASRLQNVFRELGLVSDVQPGGDPTGGVRTEKARSPLTGGQVKRGPPAVRADPLYNRASKPSKTGNGASAASGTRLTRPDASGKRHS